MTNDAALRLMRDGGQLLAVAILSRGGLAMKAQEPQLEGVQAELRQAKVELTKARLMIKAMREE
jgi:hypothetical protein